MDERYRNLQRAAENGSPSDLVRFAEERIRRGEAVMEWEIDIRAQTLYVAWKTEKKVAAVPDTDYYDTGEDKFYVSSVWINEEVGIPKGKVIVFPGEPFEINLKEPKTPKTLEGILARFGIHNHFSGIDHIILLNLDKDLLHSDYIKEKRGNLVIPPISRYNHRKLQMLCTTDRLECWPPRNILKRGIHQLEHPLLYIRQLLFYDNYKSVRIMHKKGTKWI